MSNPPKFPSFFEYRGWYNVPERIDIAPGMHHQTVQELPVLTLEEYQNIQAAIRGLLMREVPLPEDLEMTAERFWNQRIYPGLDDRTVGVSFLGTGFGSLDLSFIRLLQRAVLSERPAWRVMLNVDYVVDEAPEAVILVYPEAVRIGLQSAGESLESAIRRAATIGAKLEESRLAPLLAQQEYLNLLLQPTNQAEQANITPLMICDHPKRPDEHFALWLQHDGRKPFSYAVRGIEGAGLSDAFRVGDDRRLRKCPKAGRSTGQGPFVIGVAIPKDLLANVVAFHSHDDDLEFKVIISHLPRLSLSQVSERLEMSKRDDLLGEDR